MTQPMIHVENLGKAYKLGLKEEMYPTFREALVGMARAPIRRYQSLREKGQENELFWALKDVSFNVDQGEVVGIIGRNGAGKSTLLKILSRITEPTRGRAILRGRVASLLEVGTGFHPELSGRENVYLNGSILGMKKAEIDRKFDEIVAFAEVEQFLDTPVKRYSSGMYVRLAFAVAAHLEPEILIVDEVLAVGDSEFQKRCLGRMHDVADHDGRTVLFVSHNMAAVQSLCRHAICFSEGSIAYQGTAEEVVKSYVGRNSNGDPRKVLHSGQGCTLTSAKVVGRNNEQQLVQTLQPASIEVALLSDADRSVEIKIAVLDMHGTMIFGLDSSDLHRSMSTGINQSLRCSFEIASFPLLPGPYMMQVMIRNALTRQDWTVPDLIPFEVSPSVVYGSRTTRQSMHGLVGMKASVHFSIDEPSAARRSLDGNLIHS